MYKACIKFKHTTNYNVNKPLGDEVLLKSEELNQTWHDKIPLNINLNIFHHSALLGGFVIENFSCTPSPDYAHLHELTVVDYNRVVTVLA